MPDALDATPAGIRLSQWIEQAPIGKTAAYDLMRALGITPGKARVAGSSAPVSILTAQQQAAMDQGAAAIAAGRSISEIAQAITTRPRPSATTREPEPEQPEPPGPDLLLARLDAIARAQQTGAPLSTAEVAWLLGARPGGEVVARGRITARRHARNVWTLDPGS
jgi:hypothetical protein